MPQKIYCLKEWHEWRRLNNISQWPEPKSFPCWAEVRVGLFYNTPKLTYSSPEQIAEQQLAEDIKLLEQLGVWP